MIVKITYLIAFLSLLINSVDAQTLIGRVINSNDNTPIAAATVRLKKANVVSATNEDGYFEIKNISETDTLIITALGFHEKLIAVNSSTAFLYTIRLDVSETQLEEVVVQTGYQQLSKERATGSFDHINNDLINRSVSENILSRLEGIAPSLQFIRKQNSPQQGFYNLRVRGLSTILSETAPLIVLDNFPFDGDINSINPNDVESVTILKDAAAASIWGARAGNGVIVITTKQGRYNSSTKVTFSANQTVTERPNLYYSKEFLQSDELIDFQLGKFNEGGLRLNDWTLFPPAVELMIAEQNGTITSEELESGLLEMSRYDIRNDISKHLLRTGYNQQYNVGITGGSARFKHSSSFGWDKNLSNYNGFDYARATLNTNFSYQINDKVEFFTGVYYINSKENNNGVYISDLFPRDGGGLQTYLRLADNSGNPLPIPYRNRQTYTNGAEDMGLLNWQYIPLDELNVLDNRSGGGEIRLNAGLKYQVLPALHVDFKYQYSQTKSNSRVYNSETSYYTRDLVNRFTQPSGDLAIPLGGILTGSQTNSENYFGRVQMNYDKVVLDKHSLNALAGFEVRENKIQLGPGYTIYGYDKDNLTSVRTLNYEQGYTLRPRSIGNIPFGSNVMDILTDRFVSYYANFGYSFDNRITVTGSSRWDASNLFGVKANQKGVPLWSVGTSWNVSRESFFPSQLFDDLRFRLTYGVNGNVNKQVSALPRISYQSPSFNNLPYALLSSTGNPMLRWEKVHVWNAAVDFGLLNRRIMATVEHYTKNGKDLIGYDFLDPTTGIYQTPTGLFPTDNRINYANIMTRGTDLELTTANLIGKLQWNTTVLMSLTRNKITKYNAAEAPTIASFFPAVTAGRAPAIEGKSVDVLYALPWHGLNPKTGHQQVKVNNEISENYAAYWSSLSPEDLVQAGLTVPTTFGSVRNMVSFKDLSLSFNLVYKGGHKFRRSSINYTNLNNYTSGHDDYLNRWKHPGDELHTDVPALVFTANNTRDNIYRNNENLIVSGNHIRFQDVNLSYQLDENLIKRLRVSKANVFIYANNLGIIWRANKHGIDPDFPDAMYTTPKAISLGLKFEL